MIFVNYKAYEQGQGENAINLTKILEEVSHETQTKIIVGVSPSDIREVTGSTTLEVWSQKIDPVTPGAHTGAILAEAVYEDGAVGTFINHSENKLTLEEIKIAQERASGVGLKTLIFAGTLEELKSVIELNPTYVSYEPAELIGNVTTSVATAQPEIIAKASVMSKEAGIPLIVGAGIHSQDDVRKSIELGATGVAVASDIVKAEDPKKEILDLTEGFK